MSRNSTIVIGTILTTGFALVAACGAAVMAVFGTDNSLSTGPHHVHTSAVALVARIDDIDGVDDLTSALGQPRVRLATHTAVDVFIGVGPAAEVDAYLAGAAVDMVDDVDLDPYHLDISHRPGTARPAAPGDQTFWVARASGRDPALDWKVRDGGYRIVLMNVDAGRDVAVDGQFTVTIPHLYGVGLGVLLGGLGGAVLGGWLIIAGARRPSAPRWTAPASPVSLD